MSKAVMISIKPKWVELIASGRKTVEVRKMRPKIDVPFKCYIYCTNPSYEHEDFFVIDAGTENAKSFYGGGKVVGEFVCDWIGDGIFTASGSGFSSFPIYDGTCLNLDDYMAYVGGDKKFFGWHISDLKMYDNPKEVSKFYRYGKYKINGTIQLRNPPKSWGYVEELK